MKGFLGFTAIVAFIAFFNSCNVGGCTNSNATNYNANATLDDGSCIYPPGYDPNDTTSGNNNGGNNGGGGTPAQYCTYSIDGVPATSGSFYHNFDGNANIWQYQAYQGNIGTFPDMAFRFDPDKPEGVYTNGCQICFQGFHFLATSSFTDAYYGDGNTGMYEITNHDLTNDFVEGTFSGTLYNQAGDSLVVTNGAFGFAY